MLESNHIQQHIKQLQNNVWYSQLPAKFQAFILENSQLIHYSKEQTVFQYGDHFDGIYAVLAGAIHLGYIDIEGREAVAAIADPIMWFGEISLVDQQVRSHNAIAVQKSTLLKINPNSIHQLLQQNPEFWFHIAQLTSQKLRYAFLEIISIQTQTISQRLAQRLLFILNGYGNHVEIENNAIHLSQEQLSQMMVCSRQTINYELQQMEKSGILKVAFKKIEIIDAKALHRIAHMHK